MDHLLRRLCRRYGWRSAIEMPANGVLGMPGLKSIALARQGAAVSLVHPEAPLLARVARHWRQLGLQPQTVAAPPARLPLADGSADLAWSFCCVEKSPAPLKLLAEMFRVSRRHVLVLTQNLLSPGMLLHGLVHRRVAQRWDHGRPAWMGAPLVLRGMRRVCPALRVVELGGVDMPPWSDINMMARDLLPALIRGARPAPPPAWQEGTAPRAPASLPRPLALWHRLAERRCPGPLRMVLAHHPYVLAEVRR